MSAPAVALLHEYAAALDERRFDDWLALFTDDASYAMLLQRDDRDDTNLLAIGEDKPRLAGRIEVGRDVERDPTTHLLSAIRTTANEGQLKASFALIRRATIVCAGRYSIELADTASGLRIRRCKVVLAQDEIHGTIYLPV